jgi:hypothetical protein
MMISLSKASLGAGLGGGVYLGSGCDFYVGPGAGTINGALERGGAVGVGLVVGHGV